MAKSSSKPRKGKSSTKARKGKSKTSRKLNAYARFVKANFKKYGSFKAVAKAWKKHKKTC